MQNAAATLKRAAKRARKLAAQTGAEIVVMRDGKMIREFPKMSNPYANCSELIELGMKIIFLRDLDLYALDFMLKGMCFYLWFVFMLSRCVFAFFWPANRISNWPVSGMFLAC